MPNEEDCGIMGSQKRKMLYHGRPCKNMVENLDSILQDKGNQWRALSKELCDLLEDHTANNPSE